MSKECVEVSLSSYEPKSVGLKDFPRDVLQLGFHDKWWPQPQGAERISALPNQRFRAWVGPDENNYTTDDLHASRGRIGTLIFSISRNLWTIDL